MSPAVAALLDSADALTPEERRELADALLLELEGVPPDFKLSPEWREEIERRWADLRAGRTKSISGQELLAMLEEQRAARG